MCETNFKLPAEWHKQSFIQLTWPHKETDWAPYHDEITDTMIEMANAITRHEDLVIATQYPDETRSQLARMLSEEQLSRVTLQACPTNDTWARDHGGITILSDDEREARVLDFRFNGWGQKFESTKDNLITKHLYEAGIIKGQLVDCNDFVLEGGSIESDGEGTIFTTSQCLMAPHRNQPLTQEEIEGKLKAYFNAKRIIWLNNGNLIGDDTDGHIDTTVRICPDNTILYNRCSPEDTEQYEDFMRLQDELLALHTLDGDVYRLWGLPIPRPIYYDGERLPATYANFLILNGAVLVPTYNQPDLDAEAVETIHCAFPDREIIPIDSRIIVRQHGSIHCLTMQYPAIKE